MFVRDCMTRDPITVRPESDPLAALTLLKYGGFHHLPVTDAEGRPVGIVSRADLEVFLQTAGSPGVLKRQHRVAQVMRSDVVTVGPDCPLEEAASLMVRHRIGSLPVVEHERVTGIITKTDILKQFAALLGGASHSLRLTVQVPNTPGQLAELARRVAGCGGNITSIVAYDAAGSERIRFVLRVEDVALDGLLAAVVDQPGLTVLHVWCGDGPHVPIPLPAAAGPAAAP